MKWKALGEPSLLFRFSTFHWHINPSKLTVSNFISTIERIIFSRTFGSRSHMFLQLQHERGGMRAAGWFRNWAAFSPVTLHKLLFEKRTESGWFLSGRKTNFQHLAGSWQKIRTSEIEMVDDANMLMIKTHLTLRRTHPPTQAHLRCCQYQTLCLGVSWRPAAWLAVSGQWRWGLVCAGCR